jgi:hypothetical protein
MDAYLEKLRGTGLPREILESDLVPQLMSLHVEAETIQSAMANRMMYYKVKPGKFQSAIFLYSSIDQNTMSLAILIKQKHLSYEEAVEYLDGHLGELSRNVKVYTKVDISLSTDQETLSLYVYSAVWARRH